MERTSMIARISRDDALARLFERNRWIWAKAPVLLYLLWSFFLPGIWKLVLLGFASAACGFVVPCVVGHNVTSGAVWFMFLTQALILYGVLWYAAYCFAYLQTSGAANRAIGAAGLLTMPFIIIGTVLAVAFVGSRLGVPFEQFWSYFDRWAPFEAWRVVR